MLYLFNISYFHFFFYFFIVGALHKHFPHFMETHHGPMANRTFWIPNKIWWNLNASFNKQLLMLHERKTNKNKIKYGNTISPRLIWNAVPYFLYIYIYTLTITAYIFTRPLPIYWFRVLNILQVNRSETAHGEMEHRRNSRQNLKS